MAKVERIKTTIGFPAPLLKAARHRAVEEDCDLQDIVERAVTAYLKTPLKRAEGGR
jgi:hypothetical protein